MGKRANALADFASGLSDAEWNTRLPRDGRTVGVVVHHVASVYPLEIQLAQGMAAGKPIEGVTMDNVHEMNAGHANDNHAVTRSAALELLRTSSAAAATALRAFTDDGLDTTVAVSLYGGVELTAQFVLEDHAVRHSHHHLSAIRAALKK
jgi:hypothetical protein